MGSDCKGILLESIVRHIIYSIWQYSAILSRFEFFLQKGRTLSARSELCYCFTALWLPNTDTIFTHILVAATD